MHRRQEPQPSGAQEPPSKRPKQRGEGGQRLTLSVSTLPGADQQAQPARLSSELPCITEEAAAEAVAPAVAGPAQPPSPASRPLQLRMHGRARVDLSHAAALIAAQLLCGGSGAAQSQQPQQEHRSPAGSGCHSAGGCAGVPASTHCHGGAGIASVVTSTVTSEAGGAGAPPAGAQQQAGAARLGKRRRRGGPLGNDCEEGDGGEGSGLEDWDDCRAPGSGCGRPDGCAGGPGEDCGEACAAAAEGAGPLLAAGAAGPAAGAQQQGAAEGGGGGTGGPVRRRRVFVYGNYHRYYGYRLGQAFSEDPRLQVGGVRGMARAGLHGLACA